MNLNLTSLDAAVFGVYILGVFGLGMWASRKANRTKRDYFLAGDKLPWWMVGGSIIASNISSHHLVGAMGLAYSRGFIAIVVEWGAILIGFNALLWIFLPFYLRNGFYTMPEFLQKRYGRGARLTYGTLVLLTYVFVEISAVLYLGALSLHSLLNIPVMASVVVLALATALYTIAGGLRAVVYTEMLQLGVLLLGGTALSLATVHAAGGLSGVWATSKNWHLLLPANDPDFPWTMYLGGSLCISVFYCATNQFIVQRVLAAKNEWHARMGVIFQDYLKFLIPLIITVPGIVAPRLFPHLARPDLVFPTLVEKLLPAGLVGLVMAGLMAAVMSHLSGAINSCTTIWTMDFYIPLFHKKATDIQALRSGRVAGGVVTVAGILGAGLLLNNSDKPVFLYLLNAYGLFTPGIATMFLLGILWKRTTHAGALAAGLLTIPLSLVMEWVFPRMPFYNRTGIVFWACMAICAGVSLVTKPKSAVELTGMIWNRESLKLPTAERAHYRGIRSPFLWWTIITVLVLSFYIRFA
ncbi:MAG TPA: sodium/solute symporter [Candidatus Saccharimonadales bacterium]|nr:sodium/solute symporter [Candidatus Saccharimonadales bacterium]